MQIDNRLLEKLENLSSLKIEPSKREEVINQLSEIVNFVENLNELNLDNEEATFTTVGGGTPLREDEPKNNKEVMDIILKHSPQNDGRFFSVPTIIE